MRGKVALFAVIGHHVGITPACAGKSPCSYQAQALPRDHPRVCGEKLMALATIYRMRGSPSRVRGKGVHLYYVFESGRITPACAGKRTSTPAKIRRSRDHPRVCGEKSRARSSAEQCKGSPPRVRGKAHFLPPLPQPLRITPACAGKRYTHLFSSFLT